MDTERGQHGTDTRLGFGIAGVFESEDRSLEIPIDCILFDGNRIAVRV